MGEQGPGALGQAWQLIAEATATTDARGRYETASRAAIHAARAVLDETAPARSVRGARSIWSALARSAPAMREWADFFAAANVVRQSMRAQPDIVVPTERMADDMVRDAERFTHEVRALLLRTRSNPARSHSSNAG